MLKDGAFDFAILKLRQVLVAFALLGSNEYMDVLLLQFALWEYQATFEHPLINIMKGALDSFVGEDIELLNRLLAHHAVRNSRRSDARLLNHDGVEFNSDLLNSRSFVKGNRRYNLKLDGPEMKCMRNFMKSTYEAFLNEE